MNRLFSNQDYEVLAKDVIGDAFYSNNSFRDKISKERQYAEVIVRKVLDFKPSDQVTIGDKRIIKKALQLPHCGFLLKSINLLKDPGNKTTHTQYISPVTESDFEKVTDSFLDMLAYLPIKYFDTYKFGSRNDVMTAFSLLPPIVRYKTLEYLFSVESDNIAVADKLILSVMKAEDPDKADGWAKIHRVKLESLPVVSAQAYKNMVEKMGEEIAKKYILSAPKNMYELCIGKINNLRGSLEKGSLYRTFEEAYPYYKEYGILEDDGTEEVREFNDMMEFLYLGRKEAANRDLKEPLIVLNSIAMSSEALLS